MPCLAFKDGVLTGKAGTAAVAPVACDEETPLVGCAAERDVDCEEVGSIDVVLIFVLCNQRQANRAKGKGRTPV